MTTEVEIKTRTPELGEIETKRIQHNLESLSKRLVKFPRPRILLTVERQSSPRVYRADLQVTLGTHDTHLISKEEALTADLAVKEAVTDIKRQLEREYADIRGEDAFGVPSRRQPAELRPAAAVDESDNEDSELFEDEIEQEGAENTELFADR